MIKLESSSIMVQEDSQILFILFSFHLIDHSVFI